MSVYLLDDSVSFPHPSFAREDGLLAIGGDLSPERLALAYSYGIFPWYEQGGDILWWAPSPRYVVFVEKYHTPKNLRRIMRNGAFSVSIDGNFEDVIRHCANIPRSDSGTWLGEDMQSAFINLHKKGVAHSIEVYFNNKLVGGLYGVQVGKVFSGESMFHLVSDAGNVAFDSLIQYCVSNDVQVIDAQMHTNNIEKHGGEFISFDKYLTYLPQ